MELIKNFGIDPLMLGAQVVNFLIIFYILKRFLYKPVFRMLKDREKIIKEGIEKAQESTVLLENAKKEEIKILKNAQQEASRIIEETKTQSLELARSIEEKTKKQTEKMIAEAKEEILRYSKEAEAKVVGSISKIAMQLLQKSLTDLVSEKSQHEIVSKALRQLQKKSN